MDTENLSDTVKILSEKAVCLIEKFWIIIDNDGCFYYFRLLKALHLFIPIITLMAVYYYLKFSLISNAYKYEEFAKKNYEHIKKVNKHLKLLAKRYGNVYFCYMPMSHGTALPRTYTLFMAIKDVLKNSERPDKDERTIKGEIRQRKPPNYKTYSVLLLQQSQNECQNGYFPASRVLRMNLLMELLNATNNHCHSEIKSHIELTDRGYFDESQHDVDPLSEFNLDIMKCSRELIIQGVKDFDTMSTVYRVLETVVDDSY